VGADVIESEIVHKPSPEAVKVEPGVRIFGVHATPRALKKREANLLGPYGRELCVAF
jgi:hypothetical protein